MSKYWNELLRHWRSGILYCIVILYQFSEDYLGTCVHHTLVSWLTVICYCILLSSLVFSSFHELMQSRGVRRPSVCLPVYLSVCPSVCKLCANRYFYHRSGWIATKLEHDGPQKSPHAGCAQGQGQCQRSRDTDTFVISRKPLLLTGKWLDRHQTCTRWSPYGLASRVCSRSRSRSKVT